MTGGTNWTTSSSTGAHLFQPLIAIAGEICGNQIAKIPGTNGVPQKSVEVEQDGFYLCCHGFSFRWAPIVAVERKGFWGHPAGLLVPSDWK